jgi:hypothetical protein
MAASDICRARAANNFISQRDKKQGATGITTAAPHVAGQWGRGEDRLPELRGRSRVVPMAGLFF